MRLCFFCFCFGPNDRNLAADLPAGLTICVRCPVRSATKKRLSRISRLDTIIDHFVVFFKIDLDWSITTMS